LPARWKPSNSRPERQDRIEAQERERNAGAMARQKGDRKLCRRVRDHGAGIVHQLGDASARCAPLGRTVDGFAAANARVEVAEKASSEASMSVETVAAASEQLSASINDISQQAAHAAGIASRAVGQAARPTVPCQGLAKSAGRIGEVVGLINSIAAQTNLLR